MPLYEFQCRHCGHRFETLVFSTSRSLPACPKCDGRDLEKQYSVFGVGAGAGSGKRAAPVFSAGAG